MKNKMDTINKEFDKHSSIHEGPRREDFSNKSGKVSEELPDNRPRRDGPGGEDGE